MAELAPYKHCDLVWCQEEPRNMGAWAFVSTFIEEIAEDLGFKSPKPRYAGRMSAASPATGQHARHVEQQTALIDDALTLGKKAMSRIATRKALADEQAKMG
jgi:2-oxoglutarate dehydrogenase E1 component